MKRSTLRLAGACIALGTVAQANGVGITIVVQEGDAVGAPAFGNVTRIDNVAVNANGDWLVEVDTDHANLDADGALIDMTGVFLRENDALPAPAGSNLDSFDSVNRNGNGDGAFNLFLDNTVGGTSDDSGVYFNDVLVIQEGDVTTAAGLTPGTPFIGFFEATLNESNQILIVASIDDPAIASTTDRALIVAQVDGAGNLLSETLIHAEGDVLPGQVDPIADFSTNVHGTAINAAGDVLYAADLTGSTATDGVVYLNDTLLAQEGSPSPVAGRNWSSLSSAKVDLGDGGDWVLTGSLDGDTASNALMVRNGAKWVQEGDSLPDIAPFTLTSFGTGPVRIDDEGNVLWVGQWNDPDTSRDSGLFFNKTLVVQEGVSLAGAALITGVQTTQDGFALSENGRWAVFEGEVAGLLDAVFLVDLLPAPARYCQGKTNSLGCVPFLTPIGTPSATSTAPFRLVAEDLVPNESGFLFYGFNGKSNLGFHLGTLCVKAPLVRFLPPKNSGSAGVAPCSGVISKNFNNRIQGGADPGLTSGARVNVQLLQRDPGLGDGFNDTLTDGVQFTICP